MLRRGNLIVAAGFMTTLLGGCLSPEVLRDPADAGAGGIRAEPIEYVVTKEGVQIEFDPPAAVIGEEVVGRADGKEISIPLSRVRTACVKRVSLLENLAITGAFGLAIGLSTIAIGWIVIALGEIR